MKDNKEYTWQEIRDTNDPEILVEVLDKVMAEDHQLTRIINDGMWAASNISCPSEVLVEVLRRGKDDLVSGYAAFNFNCPPKARIDWLEATGQLTKYDPEKHELEKVSEDRDLEELRKLM